MAKREKILVVDDEQDLCEILRFNLECEGFAVETAESAEQALKMLPDGYDLILLDVMMEGMSGFRMAEKVRKEQKLRPRTPKTTCSPDSASEGTTTFRNRSRSRK